MGKEGNNVDAIISELDAGGFVEDKDYKIVAINSKLYAINTIVSLDYIHEDVPTVYAIKSDSSEDLIEFPNLLGITKDEAIEALQNAGFTNIIVDEIASGNTKGYVYTVGEKTGTFVPRQKKVWFSCTCE